MYVQMESVCRAVLFLVLFGSVVLHANPVPDVNDHVSKIRNALKHVEIVRDALKRNMRSLANKKTGNQQSTVISAVRALDNQLGELKQRRINEEKIKRDALVDNLAMIKKSLTPLISNAGIQKVKKDLQMEKLQNHLRSLSKIYRSSSAGDGFVRKDTDADKRKTSALSREITNKMLEHKMKKNSPHYIHTSIDNIKRYLNGPLNAGVETARLIKKNIEDIKYEANQERSTKLNENRNRVLQTRKAVENVKKDVANEIHKNMKRNKFQDLYATLNNVKRYLSGPFPAGVETVGVLKRHVVNQQKRNTPVTGNKISETETVRNVVNTIKRGLASKIQKDKIKKNLSDNIHLTLNHLKRYLNAPLDITAKTSELSKKNIRNIHERKYQISNAMEKMKRAIEYIKRDITDKNPENKKRNFYSIEEVLHSIRRSLNGVGLDTVDKLKKQIRDINLEKNDPTNIKKDSQSVPKIKKNVKKIANRMHSNLIMRKSAISLSPLSRLTRFLGGTMGMYTATEHGRSAFGESSDDDWGDSQWDGWKRASGISNSHSKGGHELHKKKVDIPSNKAVRWMEAAGLSHGSSNSNSGNNRYGSSGWKRNIQTVGHGNNADRISSKQTRWMEATGLSPSSNQVERAVLQGLHTQIKKNMNLRSKYMGKVGVKYNPKFHPSGSAV